jgi:transcriptional regulator with XRE-family HTH domain
MTSNGSDGGGGIRERRRAAGLSQERLAREADCSTSYIQLLEGGFRPRSGEVLGRIAHVLGCEQADLSETDHLAVAV